MNWATRIEGPVAVIGDLHGQTSKLQVILDKLQQLPDYPTRWLVFLGDFIDRGPDPQGTIDLILRTCASHPKTTAVCGNHEYAMFAGLGWISSPDQALWGERWTALYDAHTTYASYGVAHGQLQLLSAAFPPSHREFLIRLPWCVEHPQFLFVHAGLDPLSPYAVQLQILHQKDFTLTRPPWMFSKSFVDADPPPDCPLSVVSGHVRVPNVIIRPKRVLLDTSGGLEGELSCVLLPENIVLSSVQGTAPVQITPEITREKSAWWKIFG